MSDSARIVILSDLHFALQKNVLCPSRHGEWADRLLQAVVTSCNQTHKPDVVIVAGDLINFPDDENAAELLLKLKGLLDQLTMPYIVIPGNHDPEPERFYRFFPKQKDVTDVGNLRIVTFCDEEMPGYNARRSDADFAKMQAAALDWNGKLIAVQHVPVGYPDDHHCFYNYTNAPDVMRALEECHYDLCIAGHEHAGLPVKRCGCTTFVTAPGICETPFRYLVLDFADHGELAIREETVSL